MKRLLPVAVALIAVAAGPEPLRAAPRPASLARPAGAATKKVRRRGAA